MYLNRLELQGFKSFANKTALVFGSGVTCVIGPNGTGKTNVADGIRWVLGEHASRTLRARKTEDVIFAGSDKRTAMGVAEVSIALDNSEHWLPIAFEEVVVGRRAYRNGENEYFINGSRVRLRDVTELFLRGRVGQNSYAFMGQGMVEQVLSLRPEDRRALIEEAADVRIYRNKLEDAQARLKATRENLDRVRLLIAEIGPRINQLERQAGRAARYTELTRDLAGLLHVWYAHQWQEANAHLLQAIALQDQRAEELEHAKTSAKSFEDGALQLRAAIDERRNEIDLREGRLRTMEGYVRDLEQRVALDEERSRSLRARSEELATEIAALREDEARQGEASAELDTSALERRLQSARAELAAQRSRLSEAQRELLAQQRAALEHEQTVARARRRIEELASGVEQASDELARLRREQGAAPAERRRLVAELAVWAKDFARALRDRTVLEPQLGWHIDEREKKNAAIGGMRRDCGAVAEDLRAMRAQTEALQAKLELLQTLDTKPQAPDAGVRAILEAGGVIKRTSVPDDIELRGVLGLIGQLIKVPPGLERAIEAAFADNLFALVLERDSDLKAVLDLLLSGDNGRATLYALDAFEERRPLNLIKERGVLGVASQLVRCDSRYRRLVDTLLGRTVVVEDLALARKVIKRGLAGAVATLDGVLLRPVGSIAAGTHTIVQAAFVHERELADVPRAIAMLQPQIAKREADVEAAQRAIEDEERRLDELERSLDELRERRALLDAQLGAAQVSLGAFRTRFALANAFLRDTSAVLAELQRRRDDMEREREEQALIARDAEAQKRAARASIGALEEERDVLNERVGELAASVAQIDGELRSQRSVTQAERVAREQLARQIAQKEQQRAQAEQHSLAMESRLAASATDLREKARDVEASRAELEPARRELTQLESRDRSMAAEAAEANAHLRECERALIDAQNDVRIREEEMQSLRGTLGAEGFVATEDGDVVPVAPPERETASVAQNGDVPGWLRDDDASSLPPMRGGSTINPVEVRDRIAELRGQIRAIGPVNEQAAADYAENRERYDFLTSQVSDLEQAEQQLRGAIVELEAVIRERFRTTFRQVNREFERYFTAFFRGGTARLELGETDDDGLPGVEIIAQPPGKKLGSLALLSGGERSLTAVALLFALLQANPSPICVLDEVDAALDEENVGRFVDELRALSERTQFVIITHNRRTIEAADAVYGVSMGADNVSRVLSVKLADLPSSVR